MYDIEKLLEEVKIKNRVNELAQEINKYYNNKELLIISILKGSFIFTADLVRKLDMPVELDFLKASSYNNKTYSLGKVELKNDIKTDLKDKNILIIDDILDTGYTLKKIDELISSKNPKDVKICTLFDKPERREVNIAADFVGFKIPNEFIVGYGLDYNQKYRNLPYVGKIKVLKK